MTGPDSPVGRRANGLAAAEFGALVDLDPRLSETLLDRLRSAGVAAYVEPAGNAQPLVRSVVLPSRPLDRLWVDPDRADRARDVVSAEVRDLTALLAEDEPGANAHGLVQAVPRHAAHRVLQPPELPDAPPAAAPPHPTPPPAVAPAGTPTDVTSGDPAAVSPEGTRSTDPDELFKQIVAGFELSSDSPVPPWPVSEDLSRDVGAGPSRSPERSGRGDDGDRVPRLRRRTDHGGSTGGSTGDRTRDGGPRDGDTGNTGDTGDLPAWLEPDAVEEDDEARAESHFVPPPPPALPRVRPRTALSAFSVVLGLLLSFAPALLRQAETFGTLMAGLGLMLGGGFGLVSAVRDAPPTDSGPDDGAVV